MPSRVADLIEQHHAYLAGRFAEEAGRLESAKGLRPVELLGTLPEYLSTLAAVLREDPPPESLAADKARLEEAHIGLRLRLGYTQEDVTSEYVLLGRLIAGLWELLPPGEQPAAAGIQRLFDALGAAMERGGVIFTGYSLEDRQREKRAVRNLDALAPPLLSRGGDLHALLSPMLRVVQETLGAQGVELLLVDEAGRRLEFAASSGLCPPPPGAWSIPLDGDSFLARVARSDEPRVLSKVEGSAEALRPEVCQGGLQGMMGLRLWPQGRLLGAMYVGFTEARPLRPEEKRYFQTLVEYFAGVLDRALLAGQLQQSHAQVQAARAEAEAERARLLALFENAPAVVCTLRGADHVIERANPVFSQAVGSTRKVVGLPFREALPELVPQGFVGLLDQVLRTGEPFVGREVPVLLHRGTGGAPEETFFTFIYQPTYGAEGQPAGVDVFGFEVTEQVQARRRAEAATAELEAIFLGFPETLYAGDMTGLKRANLHALSMLGYSTLGELNRNIATLISELHVRRADTGAPIPVEENAFVRALQGQASTVEILLRHHGTGEDRVVRSSYAPIRVGGKVVRAVAVGIDITERRRAEEALRRSEEYLRAVVGATGVGSWELDPGTGRITADARLMALFWLPPDAPFSLQQALDIVHPEDRGRVGHAISAALAGAGGGRYETEYRTVSLDGRVRWVAALGQSYFDAKGHTVRFVGTGVDITARKEAELERERLVQELAAERARLLAVLENAPVAVAIVDPTGRVILTNKRLETELKGAAPVINSAEDYPQWTVVHPDGTPMAVEDYPLMRGLRGQEGRGEEFHYRFPQGGIGVMESSYGPVRDADGRIIAATVVFWDITERKRSEDAMRERSGFEQQLIGIVSHDLRNPLSAILLAAQALLRREELDERSTKAITRIQTAAERAVRMVRDLLDFTQARLGGGLKLALKPLDFDEAVHAVMEEVQATHPERELRLEARGAGLGAWDEDRLSQLVTNLVTNAVKYGAPGSPVTVRTAGAPGEVTLEVHNLGAPIPASLMPRLFQPLQRGTGTLPGAERSVGLGLYIVDQVVRAHGGALHVTSTEAGGTTFTVRLPRGT